MRYLADFMDMPLHTMSAFDSESMACALLDMEQNSVDYASEIPPREKLLEHSYRAQGPALYEALKREGIL